MGYGVHFPANQVGGCKMLRFEGLLVKRSLTVISQKPLILLDIN